MTDTLATHKLGVTRVEPSYVVQPTKLETLEKLVRELTARVEVLENAKDENDFDEFMTLCDRRDKGE